MSAGPRVVLLTAGERRHRHVATVIDHELDLAGIVVERKPPVERADPVIAAHLDDRTEAERRRFPAADSFPLEASRRLQVTRGEVNSDRVRAWIHALEPRALLLFGTSIVREPLLSDFERRVVNLHLGLSPYYRGSATNLWALIDGRPECVGFTVHLATHEVDAGGILAQGRPRLHSDDAVHEVGSKTVAAGAVAFARATRSYLAGELEPRETSCDVVDCRETRRRDFDATAVERVHERMRGSMIAEYLRHKGERDASFPIRE